MTEKQVAKLLKLRESGKNYSEIALAMNISRHTVSKYCALHESLQNKVSKKDRAFIVSEETCGGCIYFEKLHSSHTRPNFCSYTLRTGKVKDITVPCKRCKMKKMREGVTT